MVMVRRIRHGPVRVVDTWSVFFFFRFSLSIKTEFPSTCYSISPPFLFPP